MSRFRFIFMLLLLLSCYSGCASANSDHQLAIEAFHYGYEPTGLPVVDLIVDNRGTEAETPLIAVTLNEAVSSSQNDYIFRKRGAAKPGVVSIIPPGVKRSVILPVDKLLKAGDYEAHVETSYGGIQERERFEFSISKEELSKAKLNLNAHHLDSSGGTKLSSRRIWLTAVLITVLAILLLTINASKKSRRGA